MKVSRCAGILTGSFLTLLVLSLILDEPALLAVSASGFLFLFTRSRLFLARVRESVAGMMVTRTTGRSVIRQGTRLAVQTSVRIRIPPHCRAAFHENNPLSCATEPARPTTGWMLPGDRTCDLAYSLIPLMHGTVRFPGGFLEVADLFFSCVVGVPATGQSAPVISVHPYPLFDPGKEDGERRELDRAGPVQGFGIRSFREYAPGDDLRYVDWKISAKRGRLYVREFTTQEEGLPLIIIDLPDADQPGDPGAFVRLTGVVCGEIEAVIGMKNPVSLLLISGPNLTGISYEGRDLPGFMAILRDECCPRLRLHHLYRRRSRSSLRARSEAWSQVPSPSPGEEDETGEFFARVSRISGRHLLQGGSSRFQAGMAGFMGDRRIRDLTLYSLCDGDLSHIREVADLARQRSIRFRVRTPALGDPVSRDRIKSDLRGILVGGIRL